MKQTNNAIKFLMAQYRAIFQNAYFKGLATAAVVTMGLAAGQAQAAETVTNQASWEKLQGNDLTGTVIIDVSTSGVTANNTKPDGFTLALIGGTNSIAGSGSNAVSLTSKQGTLKLADASAALTIGKNSDGAATTLDIKALDIQKGTVTVTNTATKATTVSLSEKLGLGNGGKLVVSGSDTSVTVGTADKTTIELGSGGTIEFQASGSVIGKQLVGTGGTIHFSGDGANTWTIPNYVEGSTGTAQKQNITVDATKAGTIALAGKADQLKILWDYLTKIVPISKN